MISKTHGQSLQVWKVKFELPLEECPQEVEMQNVHLVGGLNEWAYEATPMTLHEANAGQQSRQIDAETTPLRHPEFYQYELDLPKIAEVWRRGSVIGSWLLDLTAAALLEDPQLSQFQGRVSDSGEGRWTILAAVDESVPAPVISAALFARFSSRDQNEFADKLMSAMRYEFGGHHEKKAGGQS
jgi:6-phosphogluconate dehydrogenase